MKTSAVVMLTLLLVLCSSAIGYAMEIDMFIVDVIGYSAEEWFDTDENAAILSVGAQRVIEHELGDVCSKYGVAYVGREPDGQNIMLLYEAKSGGTYVVGYIPGNQKGELGIARNDSIVECWLSASRSGFEFKVVTPEEANEVMPKYAEILAKAMVDRDGE